MPLPPSPDAASKPVPVLADGLDLPSLPPQSLRENIVREPLPVFLGPAEEQAGDLPDLPGDAKRSAEIGLSPDARQTWWPVLLWAAGPGRCWAGLFGTAWCSGFFGGSAGPCATAPLFALRSGLRAARMGIRRPRVLISQAAQSAGWYSGRLFAPALVLPEGFPTPFFPAGRRGHSGPRVRAATWLPRIRVAFGGPGLMQPVMVGHRLVWWSRRRLRRRPVEAAADDDLLWSRTVRRTCSPSRWSGLGGGWCGRGRWPVLG